MRFIQGTKVGAVLAGLLILATGTFAQADLITGEIIVSGGGTTPTGSDTNGDGTVSLGEATGIDFSLAGLVFGTSGDFLAIPFFTPVTFSDFVFNPSTPENPLWVVSFGGATYSFAADIFSIASQSDVFLNIVGSGTLSATGFDDTAGSWSFTMTTQGSQFGWSSATVPAPGSLLLLSLGLFGLGASARRRKVA